METKEGDFLSLTAQIIIAAAEIISILIGIKFVIYTKGKNIVYHKTLLVFGIGACLLLLFIVLFVPIGGDIRSLYLCAAAFPLLIFIPLLSYVRYEDDYFETLSFPFIKEKYFYRDVTEYKLVKNSTRQGPDLNELILYFGEKKVNILIGVNTGELLERINNEYRKNHNGAELPEKNEKEENIIESAPIAVKDSPALHLAEDGEDYRTILEAENSGYRILYRKKKQNHELVVNNYVYVEYIALGEPHKLCARIDGHNIAAGHNGEIYFISFDDEIIEQKTTGFGFLFK